MRLVALYLRSRQVAAGAGIALACVVGLSLLVGDNPTLRLAFAVLAIAAVTAVTATGLAGPDVALERTAALNWWWHRAAHVVAIGGLAVALGVVAGPPMATEQVVRAAVGLAGLAALGATVLGAGLAWCVPLVWTVAAVSALLVSRPPAGPLLTWLVQPPDTTAASIAAGVLGLVGLLTYALRGPRVQ